MMKAILFFIISGALVVSGFGQTRNVLVGTNNAVVQPTNFWSADASNARTGLGLGTAATNDATAFQPSSVTLSNLATNDGATLTNLTASNIAGTLSLGQGGTGATNASGARTALGLGTAATNPASAFQASSLVLSNLAISNGGALTNITAASIVGIISESNLPPTSFTNFSGTLSIAQGGTGATNAANARQNLGSTTVGDAVFIATNAAAARTVLGALSTSGDAINLTNFPTLLLRTNGNGSGLTNLTAANITGTVALASNVTGTIAISNGGSGATTAGGARTNLGLGATWLTNTTASDFLSAVGLGSTNSVQFGILSVGGNLIVGTNQIDFGSPVFFADRGGTNAVFLFEEASDAAIARTNLGLGWPALTNTNSGTGLVSVNTNGEVVSPTNFWQAAPINTRVQISQPVANATNNATNARNLFLYSLAISTTGVTNTIQLPTNGGTFLGDVATVIHEGPTSSITAVRQTGAGSNLITLNQFQEAVKFIYESGGWRLADNISYVEPIYFSGTNAAANAAASRTNLGLGATNEVEFAHIDTTTFEIRGSNGVVFDLPVAAERTRTNLGLGATNDVVFESVNAQEIFAPLVQSFNGTNSVAITPNDIEFAGIAAAATRTNLGLGSTNTVEFERVVVTTGESAAAFRFGTNQTGLWSGADLSSIQLRAGGSNVWIATTNQIEYSQPAVYTAGLRNTGTFTNNGDITINQTDTNNGLLFIRRTNAEPFLGLANLIASNNTTVSNETLFRVGVSEATNKAAQFGFRSTNTNGNGVAVFSVFGYNALMMVGPSDPNAGTNPIQATIYSIAPTNKVMTLITTNTGAMQMHRPIEWDNTTNSAVTRTNLGLGNGITTNLDIKLDNNAGMRLYFSNGILTNAVTPIP